MRQLGLKLIGEKKAQLQLLSESDKATQLSEKDVLSVLMKSNLTGDLPERMDEKTVLAQSVVHHATIQLRY